MHIAILTFDGFNELDSLIALGVLNRIKRPGWRVTLAAPTARVTSMNGVTLEATASLDAAATADAVLVGSGIRTREIVADSAPLRRNVTIEDVGNVAAFLLSDLASGITSEITYVDGGFSHTAIALADE